MVRAFSLNPNLVTIGCLLHLSRRIGLLRPKHSFGTFRAAQRSKVCENGFGRAVRRIPVKAIRCSMERLWRKKVGGEK